MLRRTLRIRAVMVLVYALGAFTALAQTPLGTAFTYQGRLTDAGAPANGAYDLQFTLYDAASTGNPIGSQVTLTSVSVSNGLFTVTLDFGASAFAGSKRWLQVGARPGGSGGAFTTLSPRQELTPSPNAAFSATTGDPGVQRRTVAPTCPAGQYVRSLAADGTPTCAPDIDTNSGGTVTKVMTGPGLTGGPIYESGTIEIAKGGVNSSMVAEGAIGLAQIDQAQVQARVGGTCASGQYLRGINPDGSVVCELIPMPLPIITTVDVNNVGFWTSIAIGSDGFPVISYLDQTALALKVAHCGNAACTAGNTLTTVDDPANAVGDYTSIAIGTDGLPVISYQDNTAGALKVAHCGNAACSAGNTLTTVDDPANRAGAHTSIAIGSDGLPVISYQENAAGATTLKVAHCGNAACSAGNTLTTVDATSTNAGYWTSIAIGNDYLPVISYQDLSGALRVAHCGDAACTAGNTLTTVGTPGSSEGAYTSIAIGIDGFPIVSYQGRIGVFLLKVAHCGNAACTAGNTRTTVDYDPAYLNQTGYFTSLAIGTDGLPVISYLDEAARVLKVARCGNAACTAGNTLTTVDAADMFSYTSIAIGNDSFPVISYYDQTARTLKVAKCNSRSCQ